MSSIEQTNYNTHVLHLNNEHGIQSFGISQSKKSIERHNKLLVNIYIKKEMHLNKVYQDKFE